MKDRIIKEAQLGLFELFLRENEKSAATIEKYLHDVRCFLDHTGGQYVGKELVLSYKEKLRKQYALTSANSMLAALNVFFRFSGWNDCQVKQFRVQKQTYLEGEKELSKAEYVRLVKTAEQKQNERLALILQTICGCGIRVSEVEAITVEAVRCGKAEVCCKGKTRSVFIVTALKKKLLHYIQKNKIRSGCVFITKNGKPVNRSNIWREMKALCEAARVPAGKVFPHNLRHLFARVFYEIEKDIAKLADILGHSSINTTRIYIMTTGEAHRQRMERMRLII